MTPSQDGPGALNGPDRSDGRPGAEEPVAPEVSEEHVSEEQVRRLLGEVRDAGPMPPAVAARLDRALSELPRLSDPAGPSVPAAGPDASAPVDLGTRRRRRRGAALLAAAVAIVAVGLGVNALRGPDQTGSTADSAAEGSSAGSSRSSPPAGDDAAQQDVDPPASAAPAPPSTRNDSDGTDGKDGTGDAGGAGVSQGRTADSGVPVVRPDAFGRDVRRLRSGPSRGVASSGQVVGERALGAGPAFVCTPPARYGVGRLLAVRYQGAAAVLAYRPPSRQSQTVDLLQCGTAQVLRSTTVPRR